MNKIKLDKVYQFERGEKIQGFFDIEELQISLPVTIINGKKEGKSILITAGIHGGEYTSIEALHRLSQLLQPQDITGKVVLIPIVNTSSFFGRRAFLTPEDKKNLNRCFPGNKEGSYSEVIAYYLTNYFISKCDFYIDCHGGDLPENLLPHLYYSKLYTDKDVMSTVNKMTDFINVPFKILSSSIGGSYQAATQLNIPSILLERGASGLIEEENVLLYKNDIINLLKGLKFLSGESIKYKPQVVDRVDYIYASYGACWKPSVTVGQYVEKGDLIGLLLNSFGNTIDKVRANVSGNLLYYSISYAINNEDLICAIAITD